MSQRKGSSEADSQGHGPPIGVRDLPRPSGPPTRKNQRTAGGGPEPPRAPEARARARARVFRWKTRPPTAFNADG